MSPSLRFWRRDDGREAAAARTRVKAAGSESHPTRPDERPPIRGIPPEILRQVKLI